MLANMKQNNWKLLRWPAGLVLALLFVGATEFAVAKDPIGRGYKTKETIPAGKQVYGCCYAGRLVGTSDGTLVEWHYIGGTCRRGDIQIDLVRSPND
jgi:hypothetical protein